MECPNLNDNIILKKGSAGMVHPGNILLRSLVQSKYEQGNLFTTKSLIMATLEEIERQGLRILTWNEKHQFVFRHKRPTNNPQENWIFRPRLSVFLDEVAEDQSAGFRRDRH